MANIGTLVKDIYTLLEVGKLTDVNLIEKFSTQIGEVFSSRFNQEDRLPTLRMSNIGRPDRQLWYELNGYEKEKITGKTLLKFSYGDATEALLVFLIQAAGHTVERLQEKIEVNGIVGHIDLVCDGVLVDIKSCSSYSFQKFKSGQLLEPGNDPFGYLHQLCGYAHALKLPAAWIAFDKTTGEICTLELPQHIIDEYDVEKRIEDVKHFLSLPEPPQKCYEDEPYQKSGNKKLSIGCSYCAFKFECHKDANNGRGVRTFMYSTGPVFLTHVVKEPTAFEIKQEEET